MEPRLKTSKKWTPLPKEFLQQVRSVFSQSFKDQLGANQVYADGRIYPEEIVVSVSIKSKDRLKQSGFSVSIGYKKDKDNVLKLLHLAVDAAGSLFEQLFSSEDDQDFPRIWQEFQMEGRSVYAQYTTNNTELEAEADKLLGVKKGEDLAGGEWEEVDTDQIKASLGIDPEDLGDDDEDPTKH